MIKGKYVYIYIYRLGMRYFFIFIYSFIYFIRLECSENTFYLMIDM